MICFLLSLVSSVPVSPSVQEDSAIHTKTNPKLHAGYWTTTWTYTSVYTYDYYYSTWTYKSTNTYASVYYSYGYTYNNYSFYVGKVGLWIVLGILYLIKPELFVQRPREANDQSVKGLSFQLEPSATAPVMAPNGYQPYNQQQYVPPQPGYAPQPGYPPQPGYAPQPQGYAPPPQGYAPPPQGYAPQPQGYAPQPQGYAPPPQGYAPQPGYQPYA